MQLTPKNLVSVIHRNLPKINIPMTFLERIVDSYFLEVKKENILADLHMHTIYSDGTNTPLDMAKKAKSRGLSAIAVTDHIYTNRRKKCAIDSRSFKSYLNSCWRAGELAGLCVVPGFELDVEEGHVLALLPNNRFSQEAHSFWKAETIPSVSELLRELGGVLIIAHIDRNDRFKRFFDSVELIDGVEYSSRVPRHYSSLTALRSRLAETAGSDAHCAASIGSAYTRIYSNLELGPSSTSVEKLFECIRKRETECRFLKIREIARSLDISRWLNITYSLKRITQEACSKKWKLGAILDESITNIQNFPDDKKDSIKKKYKRV